MSHFQFPTLASNHACNLLPLSLNKYLYFDLFHQTKIQRKPTCGIKCKKICLLCYKFHNIPLINQHWVWRRAVCCQLPVACTWRDHSQLDWVERVAWQQLSVEPGIDHGGLWQIILNTISPTMTFSTRFSNHKSKSSMNLSFILKKTLWSHNWLIDPNCSIGFDLLLKLQT